MQKFFVLYALIIFNSPIYAGILNIGETAPTFVLKNLQNENVYLRDFCGDLRDGNSIKHVVIISFFATWCRPCESEIHILQTFYKDFAKENLCIFLIDVGEDKKIVSEFSSSNQINLPVLLDSYTTTAKNYGVANKNGQVQLPQLYLINKDGYVKFIKQGYDNKENLRKILIKEVGKLLN